MGSIRVHSPLEFLYAPGPLSNHNIVCVAFCRMAARGPNVNYDDPANENFELPISTDVKGYLLESIIHGGAFGLAYKASSCTTPLDPLVLKVRGPASNEKPEFTALPVVDK